MVFISISKFIRPFCREHDSREKMGKGVGYNNQARFKFWVQILSVHYVALSI